MTEETAPGSPWESAFLAALAAGHSVSHAARSAGISAVAAYHRRKHHARFAQAWADAQAKARGKSNRSATRSANWKVTFLEALAETSNVTASATRANTPTRTVYKQRREDADFAAKWLAALHEGYDNLEMELLGYLRDPQPERKMDVASALRLLTAHRETIARQRALREDEDERAVLESIDAFIEDMRQRRAANSAILIEADVSHGEA